MFSSCSLISSRVGRGAPGVVVVVVVVVTSAVLEDIVTAVRGRGRGGDAAAARH